MPKNYPLDIQLTATVISTGDVIVDEHIQTYGGRVGILTSAASAVLADALKTYTLKVSAGQIRLPSTRHVDRNTDLSSVKGLEIPAPGHKEGDKREPAVPFDRAVINDFIEGAYQHLKAIGWPEGADDIDAQIHRQEKINAFIAELNVEETPLENALEAFIGEDPGPTVEKVPFGSEDFTMAVCVACEYQWKVTEDAPANICPACAVVQIEEVKPKTVVCIGCKEKLVLEDDSIGQKQISCPNCNVDMSLEITEHAVFVTGASSRTHDSQESLLQLGLDDEVQTLLIENGYDTVEKVAEADEGALLDIKGIGPSRLEQIITAVGALDTETKE